MKLKPFSFTGYVQDAYRDVRTKDRHPVTWTGDGFMLVEEEGSIVFIVRGLPASMDYHLILRYQSNVRIMHNQLSKPPLTCDKEAAYTASCKDFPTLHSGYNCKAAYPASRKRQPIGSHQQ